MGFSTAGLSNGGRTTYYQISYDDTFSDADGRQRALQLMNRCDFDFQIMQGWFGGVNFQFSLPINVQIADATGGASWNDPPNIELPFGYNPTVTIKPGTGTSTDFIRYLLVMEVTEMFMASQNKGWYENAGLFHGADEGSKGEGLSRFLGRQFVIEQLIKERYSDFEVVQDWLNFPSTRQNFVDNNPDDHQPDATTGCTTCFIYYLYGQLNFSINAIIAAGGGTLTDVYRNLTGKSDAWSSFSALVNQFYPPGVPYSLTSDAIFPVANLYYIDKVQLPAGASIDGSVALDNTALAEVVVSLSSDNPTLLTIPSQVIVQPGIWYGNFSISAAPITGPEQNVTIRAAYAGKQVSAVVSILPRPSVLEGIVRDTTMRPLGGSSISLTGAAAIAPNIGNTLQLSADSNGLYRTSAITPQFYQVQAVAEGFVPQQASITVGEGVPFTQLNFVLPPSLPFVVKGTVTAAGRAALAGATVVLQFNPGVLPEQLTTTTDGNGNYSITNNPGTYIGDYVLTVSMAGFVSYSATFTIPNGATVAENAALVQLGSASGTVRDTAGAPISGAVVMTGTASGISAANGAYTLASLNPGPTQITASAFGFDPVQMQVMIISGTNVIVDIALTAASAVVSGTVSNADNGLPIVGATVSIIGVGTATTAAGGSYAIDHVPAGTHDVTARSAVFISQTVSVQLIAHQTLEKDFALATSIHKPPLPGPFPV
jgi:hypothetical protein